MDSIVIETLKEIHRYVSGLETVPMVKVRLWQGALRTVIKILEQRKSGIS